MWKLMEHSSDSYWSILKFASLHDIIKYILPYHFCFESSWYQFLLINRFDYFLKLYTKWKIVKSWCSASIQYFTFLIRKILKSLIFLPRNKQMMQKIRSKSRNKITCNFHGLHKAVKGNDKQNLCEQRQFQGIQRSSLMDRFLIEIHKYFY